MPKRKTIVGPAVTQTIPDAPSTIYYIVSIQILFVMDMLHVMTPRMRNSLSNVLINLPRVMQLSQKPLSSAQAKCMRTSR